MWIYVAKLSDPNVLEQNICRKQRRKDALVSENIRFILLQK
jgi:hypothetical protein